MYRKKIRFDSDRNEIVDTRRADRPARPIAPKRSGEESDVSTPQRKHASADGGPRQGEGACFRKRNFGSADFGSLAVLNTKDVDRAGRFPPPGRQDYRDLQRLKRPGIYAPLRANAAFVVAGIRIRCPRRYSLQGARQLSRTPSGFWTPKEGGKPCSPRLDCRSLIVEGRLERPLESRPFQGGTLPESALRRFGRHKWRIGARSGKDADVPLAKKA